MNADLARFGLEVVATVGAVLLVMAAIGSTYLVAATVVFRRFFRAAPTIAVRSDAVTFLKPLCGHEPNLVSNLASFLDQDHDGPRQFLCGVAHAHDPAVEAVRRLQEEGASPSIELVVDAGRHGLNAKVSNLVNLHARASHPIVVLSDSDIRVERDYLSRVLDSLDAPGVGAVSLFYRGYGDAGFWSRVAAAGVNHQFLPGAVFGLATKLARPCMGSTIAMRNETLRAIGGMNAFGNTLADDYAMGEAIRELGLQVRIPPVLVTHASTERSLADVWRHEVRWSATVRKVVPASYLGSVIGIPIPLALAGLALTALAGTTSPVGWCVVAASAASRLLLATTVDRAIGYQALPRWTIPLRDCLSLAIFVGAFFTRTIEWRGRRHDISANGTLLPNVEYTP